MSDIATQLQEAKSRLELEIAKAQLIQVQRANSFYEASSELLYTPRYQDDEPWASRDPVGHGLIRSELDDRLDGDFAPVYESEDDLATIRADGRLISSENEAGIGVLNNLTNYTLGTGFVYNVSPFEEGDQNLADFTEGWLNQFDEMVNWPDIETEVHERTTTDGEAFIQVEHMGGGLAGLLFREPDAITEPNDARGMDDYTGQFQTSWSYGIQTPLGRPSWPMGYFVDLTGDQRDYTYVPVDEMVHIKRNVTANAKRGVSDYYAPAAELRRADKVLRNTGEGAALQSAIAWIREHPPGTTANQVLSLGSTKTEYQLDHTMPSGTTRTTRYQRYLPGTILDVKAGQIYKPGPMGTGEVFIDVADAIIRYAGIRWNMPEYMITGSGQNQNFACHDDKTEVLTLTGWKSCYEIHAGDHLATYNLDSREIEFQQAEAVHRYPYTGQMVTVRSRDVDFQVTGNHRMLVHQLVHAGEATADNDEWSYVRADGLLARSRRVIPTYGKVNRTCSMRRFVLPAAEIRRNGANDHIAKDRRIPVDDWLRFVGWWLSEGWIVKDSRTNKYAVGMSQNAGSVADAMWSVIQRLPFKFRKYEKVSFGNTIVSFLCNDSGLWTWLKIHCGMGSYGKRMPALFRKLDSDQLRTLLGAMVDGDGYVYQNGSMLYFTCSKQLADDVMEAGILAGYVCHMRARKPNGVFTVALRVSDGRVQHRCIYRKHVGTTHYSGIVWCATVQNGTLVTRRNGITGISGNSTLVSESPFVRAIERRQRTFKTSFSQLKWKVLDLAVRAGRFSRYGVDTLAELKARVAINIQCPRVSVRNKLEETQVNAILHQYRLLSMQTWSAKEDLNFEHEQAKLEEAPPMDNLEQAGSIMGRVGVGTKPQNGEFQPQANEPGNRGSMGRRAENVELAKKLLWGEYP